jgi:hypothetical protein
MGTVEQLRTLRALCDLADTTVSKVPTLSRAGSPRRAEISHVAASGQFLMVTDKYSSQCEKSRLIVPQPSRAKTWWRPKT